jgi:Ran GTPase-activating protein (RanGAP) involved in mRNA processing and transport
MHSNKNISNFGGAVKLDYSGIGMDSTDAKVLAELLKDNTTVSELHAKSNGLRAAGAQAFREVLKTNKTLAVLDLSGNEIGGYFAGKDMWGTPNDWKSTPEGPAALADGLKANTGVQQLHAYGNAFGQAGGEAFVEALKTNKTLEEIHLGNLMVGSTVRLKSSEEVKVVTEMANWSDGCTIMVETELRFKPSEFDPIPAVIPVKQLRENTITSLDLSSKTLGVDGALILAVLIKDNTSVQQLDASVNGLDQASKDGLTKAKPPQLVTLKL